MSSYCNTREIGEKKIKNSISVFIIINTVTRIDFLLAISVIYYHILLLLNKFNYALTFFSNLSLPYFLTLIAFLDNNNYETHCFHVFLFVLTGMISQSTFKKKKQNKTKQNK